MKAILILEEMPNNCVDCPLADRDRIVECCFVTGNQIINTFDESEEELVRNKDCPLKPLPQKRDEHIKMDNWELGSIMNAESRGYNNCLNEILGGENE